MNRKGHLHVPIGLLLAHRLELASRGHTQLTGYKQGKMQPEGHIQPSGYTNRDTVTAFLRIKKKNFYKPVSHCLQVTNSEIYLTQVTLGLKVTIRLNTFQR